MKHNITRDGCDYQAEIEVDGSTETVKVTDVNNDMVGTITIDNNMEEIHYIRDDQETGTLQYHEFKGTQCAIHTAKWLIDTSYQ